MTLAPVDPSSAIAVSDYLTRAREWLATAVEMTGPAQIAAAKAEIATAAEATKQLNLSKEIQQDAVEMVRRAEYALGKAIRKGQAEGAVTVRGDNRFTVDHGDTAIYRPTDFATAAELAGQGGRNDGIYGLSDDIAPEQFEEALATARAEDNLSRANVVRKARGQRSPTTRLERADLIRDLAARGYSSRQMPAKVGVAEGTIREIAKTFHIDIPADRAVTRTRRVNSTHVIGQTVTALEGLVIGLDLVAYDDLDLTEIGHWVDSLNHSLRALNRFHKQIKETIQ